MLLLGIEKCGPSVKVLAAAVERDAGIASRLCGKAVARRREDTPFATPATRLAAMLREDTQIPRMGASGHERDIWHQSRQA